MLKVTRERTRRKQELVVNMEGKSHALATTCKSLAFESDKLITCYKSHTGNYENEMAKVMAITVL